MKQPLLNQTKGEVTLTKFLPIFTGKRGPLQVSVGKCGEFTQPTRKLCPHAKFQITWIPVELT